MPAKRVESEFRWVRRMFLHRGEGIRTDEGEEGAESPDEDIAGSKDSV
jgi:hypothetical protein